MTRTMQEITRPMAVQKTAPKAKQKTKRFSGFWILIILWILVLANAYYFVPAYLDSKELILPDVHALSLNLGKLNVDQATELIDKTWNQEAKILLYLNEQMFEIKAVDLGLTVDAQTTAENAYAQGRFQGRLEMIKCLFKSDPIIVLPEVSFDEAIAREFFDKLASTVYMAPVNATIRQESNEYLPVPGIPGAMLDIETPLTQIKSNPLLALTRGIINLQMASIQPPLTDLTPLLDEIKQQLSQQFTLTAYDPIKNDYTTWTVPLDELIKWLIVDQDSKKVWLEPSQDTIQSVLEKWNQTILPERYLDYSESIEKIIESWSQSQEARTLIKYNPTNYVVEPGESLWSISLELGMPLWILQEANPELSDGNLYAGEVLTIPAVTDLLPLPVIENKRIVISIDEQHMWTYQDGELYSEHVISTGMEDSPTMAGTFQIQTHVLDAYASNWDLWMPHFLGIYEAWPGFMNGLHGLPLLSSGVRLWGGTLGRPASYGCIILDLDDAEMIYEWAEDGVVVEILP